MADTKISQLTGATTPLAGTEVLPIVQGGATVKVSVDNLTTGKIVLANGVKFPATQVASADANTLDDYEEGTFSPTLTTDGTDFTSVTYFSGFNGGKYTKIGRLVTVQIALGTSAVTVGSASGNIRIGNLPFICAAHNSGTQDGFGNCALSQVQSFATNQPDAGRVVANTNVIDLYYRATANGLPTQLPVADAATGFPGNIVVLTATYMTA